MNERLSASDETPDDAYAVIEHALDAIAEAAKAEHNSLEFYQQVLSLSVGATGAVGGLVWTVQPDTRLMLLCEQQAPPALLAALSRQPAMGEALRRVLADGEPAAERFPEAVNDGSERAASPVCIRSFAPVTCAGRRVAVIELIHRDADDHELQRGHLHVLSAMGEVAADFHRNNDMRELAKENEFLEQLQGFTQRIHRSLDLAETAYTIVNDGRQLLACDRLSVAVNEGGRARVLAISGVDHLESRSNVCRSLDQLSDLVIRTGESIEHPPLSADVPPQIHEVVNRHLEASPVRWLLAMPLVSPSAVEGKGPLVGVVIAERFAGDVSTRTHSGLRRTAGHITAALEGAWRYHRLPLRPLLGWLSSLAWFVRLGQLPKTVVAAVLACIVIAALVWIPAELRIEATGELQPQHRFHVFAPSSGQVQQLNVRHDEAVEQGQLLAEMQNIEMDVELRRVQGELDSLQQRLLAAQTARLHDGSDERIRKDDDDSSLSALEEELRQLNASYRQQLEVLQEQRASLQIRSPLTGRVLTWDLAKRLQTRPVERGQILMTVADLDGPWILELQIRDDRVGHVLAAQQRSSEDLSASFLLATDASRQYDGRLRELSLTSQRDRQDRSMVQAIVAFDREQVADLRAGAAVVVKIDCGRRGLGYVWFHELIEVVRAKLWF